MFPMPTTYFADAEEVGGCAWGVEWRDTAGDWLGESGVVPAPPPGALIPPWLRGPAPVCDIDAV